MIHNVQTKKQVKNFVYFIKDLYKDCPYYVFPFFRVQMKELNQYVLESKKYTAIYYQKQNEIKGRLLYTTEYSKLKDKTIGYYSHFDSVNDIKVVEALFTYMEEDLKSQGIEYVEGTFTPFDPDVRRGILTDSFDSPPSLFNSYNYPYYNDLLSSVGYKKALDTYLVKAGDKEDIKEKLEKYSSFFLRRHDVRLDNINFKDLDKDLLDVKQIFEESTTELLYNDAPDIELIREVAKNMKPLLNKDFVKIARENKTNRPIGFCLVVPDFNQVFISLKGKMRPLRILLGKKKITKAKGAMQYIVPDYQNTGLIAHIFNEIYDEFQKHGIKEFEGGTIVEDNHKSYNAFKNFGGTIAKTYRIYGKDLL